MRNLHYLWVLLVLPLLTMTMISTFTVPQASALTQRNFSYLEDNHCTARITCQDTPRVCGDHTCSPSEYSKVREHQIQEQRIHISDKTLTHSQLQGTTTQTNATSTYVEPKQSGSVKNK